MRTNTRYKEIYAAIKQDIEAGVYPINQKLPQGRLLAEKYQVSEQPLQKPYICLCKKVMLSDDGSAALFKTFKIEPLLNFLR